MIGGSGINAVSRLVEIGILARYLSPSRLGVFLLIVAFPEAVQQLLDCRIQEALTKYLSGFLATGQRAKAVSLLKFLWLVDVAISAVAFAIVFATAGVAARYLVDDPTLAGLMIVYAAGIVFMTLDAASPTVLRVLGRFDLSFVVGSGHALIRLALIIAMALAGAGIAGFVWAATIAAVIATVVSGAVTAIVLKPLLWDERRSPVSALRGGLREIARFLVNTNLVGTMKLASSKLDTLVVGLLAGPSTVSLYRVAVQLGTAPLNFSDPLFAVVYPTFARLESGGRLDEIRAVARRITIGLAAFVLPVALVAVLLADPFVTLVAGDGFRDAAAPFVVVLAAVAPAVILFWMRATILSLGQAGALFRMVAAATAVQLVTLFALVPAFGATGAALSMAAMLLTVVALQVIYLRRRHLAW